MSTIGEIFDRVLAGGLRPGAVTGADPVAIVQAADTQRVARIPAAVEAVWRLVGGDPGPWWMGSKAAVSGLDGEIKELALETLDYVEGDLRDPKGLLVLLIHGADEFHVVDGADLALPDPPVWLVQDGRPLTAPWPTVTAWFESAAADVLRHRDLLRETLAEGGSSSTAAYFVL
ncbi:hypothetical protein GCM10022243_38010 [Saccharothrix violaceirubra]|uniref:SMI1/KNR4 family protein n=1 Tax=Saccharothrix violaceirubra TaxID=413306 RepID=A0A7W7T6V1_9PSEU|nr:hypothetical protein [Saccharothrix violaceirubra]MBB4966285.1 hypothetical protein [Saccharothrix violaceirubra]